MSASFYYEHNIFGLSAMILLYVVVVRQDPLDKGEKAAYSDRQTSLSHVNWMSMRRGKPKRDGKLSYARSR